MEGLKVGFDWSEGSIVGMGGRVRDRVGWKGKNSGWVEGLKVGFDWSEGSVVGLGWVVLGWVGWKD